MGDAFRRAKIKGMMPKVKSAIPSYSLLAGLSGEPLNNRTGGSFTSLLPHHRETCKHNST
jgi:hypothetical protein